MNNVQTEFHSALSNENYSLVIDIIKRGSLINSLHFDDRTFFEHIYDKFYSSEFWGDPTDQILWDFIFENVDDVQNLNFNLNNHGYSFWGSLFHTTLSNEFIKKVFFLGGKPAGSEGDLYFGAVASMLNPIVSQTRKEWGLKFLQDNSSSFDDTTLPQALGKVIPDSFVPGQQRSLWQWAKDEETIAVFGDISRYEEKYIFDVELVLENGANINQKSDEEGHTGVMRAAMTWMPEAIEFLISKEADVNITNDMGNTALMYVSGYLPDTSPMNEKWEELPEHLQIAKILVEAGADISIKNKNGDTAIDLARKNKNTAVLEFLESL